MSDERGRKRDTPTGMGPAKPGARAPRGAGLSGNLPGGARYGSTETTRGVSPVRVRAETPLTEPKNFEPIPSGPWDASTTPPRGPIPDLDEPEHGGPPPPPPSRQPPRRRADPMSRAGADAFAATRPAELSVGGGMRAFERAVGREQSDRPVASREPREPLERGVAPREQREHRDFPERTPSYRPEPQERGERLASQRPVAEPAPSLRPGVGASPRPPEPKPSLRLKLDVDSDDVALEGRVRVPKRRAPVLLGMFVILAALAGGAFLWIDAHGGVENFVTALQRVLNGEPPVAVAPPPTAATPTPPEQAPQATDAPAANTAAPQEQAPVAQAPTQPPQGTTAEQPKAAEPPKQEPQIATGEVEAPDEAAAAQQPTAAAPSEAKPAAEKPARKPKPARVVKKQPVKRDPVIRIEQLGEGNVGDRVLGAAPPDPSGAPVLPPPDPPAPE